MGHVTDYSYGLVCPQAGIEITGDSAPVRNGRPARAHHHRGPPTSDAPPAAHQCKLCREAFTDQLKLNQHLGSNRHRIQHAVSMLKKKGALSSDQHGVQVLSDAPAWGLKVGQVRALKAFSAHACHSCTFPWQCKRQ